MIQRIQTIYLLALAILSGTAIMMLPSETQPAWIMYVYMILFSLVNLFAIVSIFLYKNRKRQMLFCKINLGVTAAALALCIAGLLMSAFAAYFIAFPVACLLLCYFALRGIKKDDELVRSMDRLR